MAGELNAGIEGNWSDKDIVIALVGPTVSGKSSFVEKAAGIEGLSRGSLRSSGTEEICVFKFPFPGVDSSICLVDTPGIDGEERDLYDIFDMIYVWLNKTYRKESSLAGILYFHSISNTHMFRSPSKKLNYLKRLCQNKLNRVTLTTTMWGSVYEGMGTLKEDELKRLCKPLIDDGLSVKQFLNNPSSAFDILRPIVQAASSRIGRALLVRRSLVKRPPPIIVIIGPYGGGKSQFIDCLTQETAWANHTQLSRSRMRSVRATLPTEHKGSGSIVLVDTPGFNGDMNPAILEDVSVWLGQSYPNSTVAGFLFLHNIRDRRLLEPPSMPILNKMGAMSKLIFVTTHWDQIMSASGIAREKKISLRLELLLSQGARIERSDMRTETAWRILHPLLRDIVQ